MQRNRSGLRTLGNLLNTGIRLFHTLVSYSVDLRRDQTRRGERNGHECKTNERAPAEDAVEEERAEYDAERAVEEEKQEVAGLCCKRSEIEVNL